ncbi:hypothetical protein PVAND_011807 [Polypedilum vanderplanki]|uniref:Uncharacterized protein n=1 Tax=Polypedilum vanderplanki TaxID=319348 RepID=A0A9J6CKJ8_POLVA|nr:hypothetical protein PVAND_011807 [Polypedilum vanderplanki]
MEQQDYNESFGFMNSLTEHEDNFQIIGQQEESEESQRVPLIRDLENNEYQQQTITTKCESVQYHDISSSSQVAINQKSSGEFDIKSDPILETQLNLQTNDTCDNENSDKLHSTIVKKENIIGKKRKRILLLNDDDEDSDNSENIKNKDDYECQISSQEPESKKNFDSFEGGEEADVESEDNEEISEIVVNPDALKAKFLLKTAIIIQDPDKKKKKKPNVLDSDEEDDQQTQSQIQTSIDDIGLVVENETFLDNEEVLPDSEVGDIIIFNEPSFERTEENESENMNEKLKQNEDINQPQAFENSTITPINKTVDENDQNGVHTEHEKNTAKVEVEENIDEVLDRIKPMADDDDFFKYKKSSDDEEDIKNINNEEYFGSPDKSVVQNLPKKRGPKPGSKRKISEQNPKIRQRRGDRYEKDFVDDSATSDDSSYSDSLTSSSESSSSESSVEEVISLPQPRGRPPDLKKLTPPTSITIKNISTQKESIAKKDRFYDQSRNIPDSVYFGDVKVPLHILHTRWNSSVEDKKCIKKHQQSYNLISVKKSPNIISSKQFIESDDPKLSTLKDLVKIAGIKINYTKLFDGIKSTDHKCMIIRRILAQKGISGEPTVAKCKKLRRDLQAKRESAELDKSVIINEGRTRRSRNLSSSKHHNNEQTSNTNLKNMQPEIFETLSKIKSVIDSDSE